MAGKPARHTREPNNKHQCVVPKQAVLALFSIMLFVSLSASSLATLNVLLSDQGTGVKDKVTQQTITLGNLTVEVYDALTGGNLIYTQTFSNVIKNGSWNVMLGETTALPLEFGKAYYRDYKINGEDASFTNTTGQTVGRQVFYSSLGDVNGSKLITGTVTRNKIESCANGQIIKMSGGTWTCANEAAFTDTNCSIDGSCPNIIYNSEEATLNVNSTTWWAQLTGWVAGWFYKSGNNIQFNETRLNATIDARTSGLGDNTSWNEGYANTKYLQMTDQRYNDTAAINNLDNAKLNKTDQRYNDSAAINSLNTTKAATGNCAAGYAMQNTTSTGVQCVQIPALSETDPVFTSQNTSIWSGINSKLTATDQRYNDTTAINNVETSANSRMDTLNSTKLDKTDQRYNDTTAINTVNTNTNARIDSINSTKAAAANCAAGYVVQNTTTTGVQCLQIPALSETDPIFTTENASIWSGINSKLTATDQRYNDTAAINTLDNAKLDKTDQRYNDTAAINTVDNAKLDKTDQRYNDTARISSIGNWTADKPAYTATSGLVAILGNWSLDKPGYITAAQVDAGYYNKTSADSKYATGAALTSIGNWTLDKPSYATVSGNINTSNIVASVGNWTLDQPSYITSAAVDTGYYNKTVSDGKYATSAALTSIGNWTLDKPTYTATSGLVAILGNWSLDKPNYATSAALSSVGNWTLDKTGYYNKTQTDGLITQNITNHQNTFKHGNTTQEIFGAVDNQTFLRITDQRYNDTTRIDAVNTTSNIQSLGFVTGQHRKGGGAYLYNDTDTIYLNETKLNATIDNRDSDTTYNFQCPAGQFVKNLTSTGGYVCEAASGSGDITSVQGDNRYIYNGSDTSDVNLAFNETKLNLTIDARASGLGDNASWNESYANTKYLQITDQRYNDTTAISSIGNWTADKPSYTATSGLVAILGNWSADKASYVTSTLFGSIGNWSLDKPGYTLTSGLVSILGNWSLDKPSYTVTSGLVAILGNWSLDKSSYYTKTEDDTIDSSRGNWSLDKPNYTNSTTFNSIGNWTADKTAILNCSNMTNDKLLFNTTDYTFYCGTDQTAVGGGDGDAGWVNSSVAGSTVGLVNTAYLINSSNGILYEGYRLDENDIDSYYEDFHYVVTTYQRITTAPTNVVTETTAPTLMNFPTPATANGDGGLVLAGDAAATTSSVINVSKLNVIETRFKFGTTGGNATRKDIIGLFKSGTTLVQNTSLSGIFFYYNSTNQTGWTTMNWTFVVCNNSRVVTSSSCQYLNTTTIANTTAWHTFRIQGNNAYNATATRNTAWTATIDGVTVGMIGNNTIVPDSLTASTLGSWSESIDVTADQTWFDYYYYELKR